MYLLHTYQNGLNVKCIRNLINFTSVSKRFKKKKKHKEGFERKTKYYNDQYTTKICIRHVNFFMTKDKIKKEESFI